MRLPSLSKGLLSLGLLSGLLAGASSCSSDYGLFDVHVEFVSNKAEDRDLVELCKLTVTDDSGRTLLKNYVIDPILDTGGELISGCMGGGKTKRVVGDVSYSTSRTSGSLNFVVYAVNAQDEVLKLGCANRQTIKVFQTAKDEQNVPIQLDNPDAAKNADCPKYK
jgi:hypothetical protein